MIKPSRIYKNFMDISFYDFLRKVTFKIFSISNFRLIAFLRSFLFFKSKNVILGKNVTLNGGAFSLKLGKSIRIYNNCIFELGPQSKLYFGDNIIFSYGCIVSVNQGISIGNNVQIGEFCSIRDTTHDYTDFGRPMMFNNDLSERISIGNDVWIGRNCLIRPGAIIEDGVVVGANSIVKGTLERGFIYAGNPIKKIKQRPDKLPSRFNK